VSAVFGLSFGALCAIPYLFTGTDLQSGLSIAFGWWVAGIPWDIAHCVGNFVLMLLLYKPLSNVMINLQKKSHI
jgi:energy-coupling factor transport system substrate-specific component